MTLTLDLRALIYSAYEHGHAGDHLGKDTVDLPGPGHKMEQRIWIIFWVLLP